MIKATGLNLMLSSEYLHAAVAVSLLSVLVLIFLFFYLNWYTGRRYFSTWTLGWIFYAVWLGLGPGLDHASPFRVMLKHCCVGLSAALLLWGSVQFLKMPSRPMLFCLFMGFLLTWSYVGAYHLSNPLEIRAPIFVVIGLASLVTAFSFYRLRKHREYLGAGLLTFGFVLWGVYLGVCPFFAKDAQMAGAGFLISAVLQLFIAVSMIILVLEEAKAANELILNQIRACHLETRDLETRPPGEEAQYHGVFDRSSLNETLRAAYGQLRQAQQQDLQQERLQALAQMSRGISHDINNALTPIMGYSNLLLREYRDLPPNVLNHIQSIRTAGEKIGQSVSCIRDFYRTRDGGTLVPLDLNALAREALAAGAAEWRTWPRLQEIRTDFESELDPALPGVMGHADGLRQSIMALVLNAAQAMPSGGALKVRTGVHRKKASLPDQKPDRRVFVEVVDNGVGMDDDTRRRCLEPFFTTKGQHGAKGLGLSKVYGVVRQHQGEIEIESQPGRGTVVRLVLLAVPEGSTERFFADPATAAMPPLKILCIDDEPSILDILKLTLKRGGHNVEVAGDGHGGLEAFRSALALREPFDVVVTDLGMPKMDGQQVALLVKKASSQTPVILLTGWGGIMLAEGKQPEHIDVILSKPPQVSELLGALRKVTAK
jgi:signal transduction histidine kinase/ActR/RegA family two-component response regulator